MDSKKLNREIAHFEKVIGRQSESWWGNLTEAGQRRLDRRRDLAIVYGNINRNDDILELGCASGEFTSRLKDIGARVIAIDISLKLLKLSSSKIQQKNVIFCISDAEKLPFRDGAFDVVIGNAILHHLNILNALREVARVVKLGGKIVFFEPNMLNPQVYLEKNVRFIGKIMQNSPDETAFFKWQIRKYCKRYFENVKVIPFDFLHPAIPDNLAGLIEPFCNSLENVPILKEIAGSLFIKGERV